MKLSNQVRTFLIVLAILTPALQISHVSAEDKTAKSAACARKVTLINNRSQLLQAYKQSQEKKYQQERKKWATRISYSSQWAEKDAEDARKSLYKYDQLHNAFKAELDKQIEAYRYLQTAPLTCNDASKAEIKNKLSEIKGLKSKKAVGGQAMIRKLKHDELAYTKGDFKKETDQLIAKLHQEKAKHPAPKQKAFEVKNN